MAGILVGLVILLVTRPDEAEAASYNCAIENITVVAESNSATVTWDTSPDCEQVRKQLLHLNLFIFISTRHTSSHITSVFRSA